MGSGDESNLGSIRLRQLGGKLTEVVIQDSLWLERGPNLIKGEFDRDREFFSKKQRRISFERIRCIHPKLREYIMQALREDLFISPEDMFPITLSQTPRQSGTQTKVFISYAHEDLQSAIKLYNELKAINGVSPWFDKKNLLPGMKGDRQ